MLGFMLLWVFMISVMRGGFVYILGIMLLCRLGFRVLLLHKVSLFIIYIIYIIYLCTKYY